MYLKIRSSFLEVGFGTEVKYIMAIRQEVRSSSNTQHYFSQNIKQFVSKEISEDPYQRGHQKWHHVTSFYSRNWKYHWKEKWFDTIEKIKEKSRTELKSISKIDYQSGSRVKKKYETLPCILSNGGYIQGGQNKYSWLMTYFLSIWTFNLRHFLNIRVVCKLTQDNRL